MNAAGHAWNEVHFDVNAERDTSQNWAVVDALNRFGAGQDLSSTELLASAFTEDAWLDFVHPASLFGAAVRRFHGREQIVLSISDALKDVMTTHSFTNHRVDVKETNARLHALCEAQHIRQSDKKQLLLKNWYWCDLELQEGIWKLSTVVIRNAWFEGSGDVLFKRA